ncbi:malectin-like isoform X2 [Artemia franciscana]|uniref:malectin-like isoform X2 n=1 Tax=Artemia franciscana TaxID=6661 RepID=UPI0032DAFF7A
MTDYQRLSFLANRLGLHGKQMDTFTSFWPFVNGTLIVCNLTLDCEEFSPKDVVYAVNCGGDYFKDSHGINYQSDKSSSGIASDFGKQFLVFGRVSQSDSVLYQTEKYDHNTFGYDVPLDGDGDYVLVLKFSEVYWNSPGAKVFGVLLNNRHRVISDLDIYEKVGKAVAHDEYIPFSVQNGKMNFNGESSTVYDSFRLDFLKDTFGSFHINCIKVTFCFREKWKTRKSTLSTYIKEILKVTHAYANFFFSYLLIPVSARLIDYVMLWNYRKIKTRCSSFASTVISGQIRTVQRRRRRRANCP